MSRYLTPVGVVEACLVVQKSTGQQFIRDPQGRLWRLADCTPVTSPPLPPDPGETSLAWDDPRLSHKHRLKGSGIPWAKPLSEGIPPWRWDGYWSDDDREDG